MQCFQRTLLDKRYKVWRNKMGFLKMLSLNIAACWCFVRWSIEIINNISFLNRNVERITMIILKKIMSHCLETKLNAFMQTYARYVTAVVGICSLSKHWHTDSSLSDSYHDLGPCEAGDPCDNGSVFGKKMEPKYIYSWVPVPMWERLCRSSECSSSPCLHGYCYDSEFTPSQ